MFEEIGQFPKVAFEMEEDSSMAGLVAQGFGIAVMLIFQYFGHFL